MTTAIENLELAQQRAMAGRPKIGGFPYLAETLRGAGVSRNLWFLPACQSFYFTDKGTVVIPGTYLLSDAEDVPQFNQEALIVALRRDQSGEGSFPEFLMESWKAGVVKYDVDFIARTCTYYGIDGAKYIESYPACDL
jgi:uncharacterized protein YbcV (DUF1398 family)